MSDQLFCAKCKQPLKQGESHYLTPAGKPCNIVMTDSETFEDWFYREYRSTPERERTYRETAVKDLMRATWEASEICRQTSDKVTE